jgi:signal transduction histidine kinase/ActR/RegA family two-component response regulator
MTDHLLDQAVELTRDHQLLLADLAARIEPYSNELAEAWAKIYRETAVRQPLPPDAVVRGIQEEAVRLFFGGLKGDLREYFASLLAWARQIAFSGLSYDRLLTLMRGYQRSGLPFLMRAYPIHAELQLALGALDDLYGALVTLIGAAYIEVAQGQLVRGVRLHALGQLASGAAHSLNNVLAAILGRMQLLLERTRDDELHSELQEVQRTAAIGAQMVRRLQDFARVGSEEKVVESDVNLLMRDAAEITRFLWRDQAEASGIIIDVVRDFAEVPPVLARPKELREVFTDLIINAIEAMPRGGLITLRTERKGNAVLVSVIDTGEGMSEATRLRVFDPFFTTKGSSHAGLGLSTAEGIVAQHNGAFTVESEPGRGTTFTLSLPVAQRMAKAAPKPTPAPVSTRAANILIIDDELMVRDIVAKFLTFHGYPVVVADSGPEGIAAFKENKFDLVLTDLGMPGMSGWEVAREIKRLNPKVLVVLMTGWAAGLDPEKVKEGGIDRVVHKPFDVDEVLTLIGEAVVLREKM